MVVDWQDHMWVEVLLPVGRPAPEDGKAAKDGGTPQPGADANPLEGETEAAVAGDGQLGRRRRAANHGRRQGWRQRGKRRGEFGPEYRWVHLDPCEAAVDEPTIVRAHALL